MSSAEPRGSSSALISSAGVARQSQSRFQRCQNQWLKRPESTPGNDDVETLPNGRVAWLEKYQRRQECSVFTRPLMSHYPSKKWLDNRYHAVASWFGIFRNAIASTRREKARVGVFFCVIVLENDWHRTNQHHPWRQQQTYFFRFRVRLHQSRPPIVGSDVRIRAMLKQQSGDVRAREHQRSLAVVQDRVHFRASRHQQTRHLRPIQKRGPVQRRGTVPVAGPRRLRLAVVRSPRPPESGPHHLPVVGTRSQPAVGNARPQVDGPNSDSISRAMTSCQIRAQPSKA